MNITLKTLTPIWTGGVETGTMDRLHETGLLGSLRWWYEALVRGLGGDACDPTLGTCKLSGENLEKYKRSLAKGKSQREALCEAKICDVCQVFGATGWRRRFRLVVESDRLMETWSGGAVNIKPPGRKRGWYLNAGQMGTFNLKIVADEKTQAQLLSLIQFIAKWGALGARPQLGYGFIEIVGLNNQPQATSTWQNIGHSQSNHALPNLGTFTFFMLDFEPQRDDWWGDVPGLGTVARDNRYRSALDSLLRQRIMPVTPALKNVLRYGQRWSSGALPHQFFGTLRAGERSRSKIALSWAYQKPDSQRWRIRGWAYPPGVSQNQQHEVQQRLQAVLGKPETWLRALNIRYRSAQVSLAPTPTFFQPVTSPEVQNFVHGASFAKVEV